MEQDVANELLESISQDDQQQYIKKLKTKKKIILWTIITLTLIGCIFLVDLYNNLISVHPTKVIDVIEESETISLSDSEFKQL